MNVFDEKHEPFVMKNQLLKIEIVDEVLHISIGMEALKAALESGRLDMSCDGEFVIDDTEAFGVDFVNELKSEEEDGSTPIHLMFDRVALTTMENGGVGCSVVEYDDY